MTMKLYFSWAFAKIKKLLVPIIGDLQGMLQEFSASNDSLLPAWVHLTFAEIPMDCSVPSARYTGLKCLAHL